MSNMAQPVPAAHRHLTMSVPPADLRDSRRMRQRGRQAYNSAPGWHDPERATASEGRGEIWWGRLLRRVEGAFESYRFVRRVPLADTSGQSIKQDAVFGRAGSWPAVLVSERLIERGDAG